MKGRTPEVLVRRVNEWHRSLANDNHHQVRQWEPHGIEDLDVDRELQQGDEEYLHVVSQPPQYVRKVTRFEYQIEVKSSDDKPEFVLESGPDGMRIREGLISWRVPRKPGAPFDAAVTVRNSSGKETTHAFRLSGID